MARVLVVDDDEAIRETLRLVLEDAGHSVQEAPDGLRALDLLRTSAAPMVVLLDLMMPRLGGAGVLGVVAEDERLAALHSFLLVTASCYGFPEPFSMLLQRLSVMVVQKPFDIDDLLAAVTEAERKLLTPPSSIRDLDREAHHLYR